MAGALDLKDILARNPHIDENQLLEGLSALRSNRKGPRRSRYNLSLPYAGRRVTVVGNEEPDPRTIYVGRSRK